MNNNSDDHLVANIVLNCVECMRNYDTNTKMTACYNLVSRILNLYCICAEKKDVIELIDEFSDSLKKEINERYED